MGKFKINIDLEDLDDLHDDLYDPNFRKMKKRKPGKNEEEDGEFRKG